MTEWQACPAGLNDIHYVSICIDQIVIKYFCNFSVILELMCL